MNLSLVTKVSTNNNQWEKAMAKDIHYVACHKGVLVSVKPTWLQRICHTLGKYQRRYLCTSTLQIKENVHITVADLNSGQVLA